MSEARKVYKPQAITGFPEWLPAVRRVEQIWFDHIRRVFESYGFCSIETPSVEALDVLRAKGEVDKEIYCLERLHKDEGDEREARLALHFDQTVPLARYVAQHFNALTFPFKRYQIQRVWRGERPQKGRFREFYQCDIDVINVDSLPLSFDAEFPAIMWEVFSALPGMEGASIQIRISNRKILLGFLQALNLPESGSAEVLRLVDKMEKIGREATRAGLCSLLADAVRDGAALADRILDLVSLRTADPAALTAHLRGSGVAHPLLEEGVQELSFVLSTLSHLPAGAVVADLSIVRGLDYYTGTVYETVFTDDPGYGSICSGGRYDDLAGAYINKSLPGVGISLGFSRLFAYMLDKGTLPVGPSCPADILMVLPSEARRADAADAARRLRARGLKVELYHKDAKVKNQLSYAEKKGIPYVWFPPFEEGLGHEVKDMSAGTQGPADPETWQKPL